MTSTSRTVPSVTVIGGGLAGLIAATTVAEAGLPVRLLESHSVLGGRGRTTTGAYKANLGPHAVYNDGPLWAWLDERNLVRPVAHPRAGGYFLRHQGERHRLPPASLLKVARFRNRTAPVDQSFREWMTALAGEEAARLASNVAGVFTFDANPGRLSARFVWERLVRVTLSRPPARYPVGGWQAMVERIAEHAWDRGVTIETGVTVSSLDDVTAGPVIIATEARSAYRLLGREVPPTPAPTVALLDVGMVAAKGDAFIVSDLDEAGWVERFSAPDPTLAPEGHSLVQCQVGTLDGETLDEAERRLERLLEVACPGWRARERWRRRSLLAGRAGAVDLPGHTWRDREAIDQGDGVYLCGDWVAAPGLLGEVSWASAVDAATRAVAAVSASRASSAAGRRRAYA